MRERREAARREVERLAELLVHQPIGVQVGVVEDSAPSQTFQVFESNDNVAVTLSPYRLGDHPNISAGIAMVTSTPEAVRLFKATITGQWNRGAQERSRRPRPRRRPRPHAAVERPFTSRSRSPLVPAKRGPSSRS